jgi:hypothetical protein
VSYVDFVSNAAVLEEVDLRNHLIALIESKFPLELLPAFLHEAAHHSCFLSPVGNALALLRLRTYRQLLRQRDSATRDTLRLLEDHYRYEASIAIMRPLAEGIACFQEFDSLAGKSNVINPALLSAFWCFDRSDDLPPPPEPPEKFPGTKSEFLSFRSFSMLYHVRIHHEALRHRYVERRENVLADCFSTEGGGYLSGYLTVKSFWKSAVERKVRDFDREVFLAHLKSFFYDDYAFVAKILDPDAEFPESINAIGAYFQERLRTYFKLSIDEAYAAYERSNSDQRNKMPSFGEELGYFPPHFDGLGLSADEAKLGEQRLRALFDELLNFSPQIPRDELETWLGDQGRQRRRELLCIGSTEAQVEVNEYERVLVYPMVGGVPAEDPMLSCPALPGVRPGCGEGVVEAYMLPGATGRAILVSRRREGVYAFFDKTVPDASRKRVLAECGHRSKDLEYIRQQEALLTAHLASEPLTQYYNESASELDQQMTNLYLHTAGGFIRGDDNWRRLSPILHAEGIFGVLGRDSAMLRGVALLALLSSVGEDEKTDIVPVFQKHNLNLDEFLKKCRLLRERDGVEVIAESQSELTGLI